MQVVEWVLGSVRSAWTAPEWQQHVASPAAFLKHYMPVERSPQGTAEVLFCGFLRHLHQLATSPSVMPPPRSSSLASADGPIGNGPCAQSPQPKVQHAVIFT